MFAAVLLLLTTGNWESYVHKTDEDEDGDEDQE